MPDDLAFYPHTTNDGGLHALCCNRCGKSVSTWFVPLATETPDRGLIVRAIIHCPECFSGIFGIAEGGEAAAEAVPTQESVE